MRAAIEARKSDAPNAAELEQAADVEDPEGLAEGAAQLEEALGPVYGLVANAGIGIPTARGHIQLPRDAQTISINVNGVIHAVAAVQPGMLERGEGFLAVVSSVAATRGLPGSGAYCASKAGLAALLESLRIELRTQGVQVSTICPGFVKTPLTDRNRFPMPFILEVDDAARRMHRAIRRRRSEYSFPWPLSLPVRMARFLPNWIYDRMLVNQKASKTPLPTDV